MKKLLAVITILISFSGQCMASEVTPQTKIIDLKANEYNGNITGPALPGSNGIKFLKEIAHPQNMSSFQTLLQGKICKITACDTTDSFHTFDIGHHYGIFSIELDYNYGFTIHGENVYHNPESFYIKCIPDQNLTVRDVEDDLGNAISFY